MLDYKFLESKYTIKGEKTMEVNEQKRQKFIENAGKRVNNVLHDIQILEPMARSNNYDFTKADVEEMFTAMQETLNNAKEEYYKKFELKAKSERKAFVFGQSIAKVNDVVKEAINGVQDEIKDNEVQNDEEQNAVITNDDENNAEISVE